MSTIKVDAIVDASGGNNATVNGVVPQPAIGFTPVQQGGPTGTGSNKIYLGWNTNGSGILTQVDTGGYLGRLIVNAYTTSTTPAPTQLYAPGEMPLFACRAWGVCDASGNFVAGGNVASMSGTNPVNVTFTVHMPNVNYSVVVSGFGGETNTRYPLIRYKDAGGFGMANGGGPSGGLWFAVFY
jgi:hypothetical protein